jgi:beta-galactosidase
MIEYWHWHTLPFGAETYWGGVLPHSQVPGRTYHQLAALGDEFRRAGASVAGLTPDADISIVYSNETKWALEEIPTLTGSSGAPDQRSYRAIIDAFYRGAFDAGLQVRFVHTSQLFEPANDPATFAADYPVLVAAGVLIAGDEDLKWLERYAFAGGHLVVGVRTGYEDDEARARVERKPAFLDDAAGVWYEEFSTIEVPITVTAAPLFGQTLPADAAATRWIDGLNPDRAETLISYQHPHFGRWPAMTSRAHGRGRVSYVGTVPNLPLAIAINRWLTKERDTAWRRQSEQQTVTGGTAANGTRLRIIHNWSFTPSDFALPAAVTDLLSDDIFDKGAELRLGAWDVRVLVESR